MAFVYKTAVLFVCISVYKMLVTIFDPREMTLRSCKMTPGQRVIVTLTFETYGKHFISYTMFGAFVWKVCVGGVGVCREEIRI